MFIHGIWTRDGMKCFGSTKDKRPQKVVLGDFA